MSLKDFLERSEEKFGDKFELLSRFESGSKKIKIKCKQHDTEYNVLPYSFLRSKEGCCPECVKKSKIRKTKFNN